MALPSTASRLRRERSDPAALISSAETRPTAPLSAAGLSGRVKAWLADHGDRRIAQIVAGKVFLIRVGSALLALVSQVLLARWMGSFEFGLYIYAWTWVLMIGALSDVGLSSAARRFIPEYTGLGALDPLRGFLFGSRWLALTIATAIALIGALIVTALTPWLDHFAIVPLYLACTALPIYGLVQAQAGIAQSYDWPNLALMPFYILRQLAITVLVGAIFFLGVQTDAVTAMLIAVIATWAVTLGQFVMLNRRLRDKVPAGPRRYEARTWFATSIPIFVVEGFYLLLSYVDILALEHFGSPDDVAVYYAAARLLAIVAFVYFAIASATTHKFTEYHLAGDRKRLAAYFAETARWTFWPSLAICAAILALGRPLLSLFGSSFVDGYHLMFLLAIGLMARAAVGPAERLLNMLGVRKGCAMVYAAAFALNLALCVVLIPRLGADGAAIATSSALVLESILLYLLAKRRLGFHTFILGAPAA